MVIMTTAYRELVVPIQPMNGRSLLNHSISIRCGIHFIKSLCFTSVSYSSYHYMFQHHWSYSHGPVLKRVIVTTSTSTNLLFISSERTNEKRERVVKASRDITMNIKKVIYQVHEYVEAATFNKFCLSGTLFTLGEINTTLLPLSDPSLEPLQITILDYLLGLAYLTGELMRMAIGRISDGEIEFAQRICQFVRQIQRELMLVTPKMDDSYDMNQRWKFCFKV